MTIEKSAHHMNSLYPEQLLRTLTAVKKGDFSVRMPNSYTGMGGKVADALNDIIELNQQMASELERVSRDVGENGNTNQRVSLSGVSGSWSSCVNSVNMLITDLVHPINETTRITQAVARGDFSQVIDMDTEGKPLKGEFLRFAKHVNKMMKQLNLIASGITRFVCEIDVEGGVENQVEIEGIAGIWQDLVDSINLIGRKQNVQLQNIVEVTAAVASGDLSKKITVDARGKILELKYSINKMVDHLNWFASEVTRVAREVGSEGKLGGQAKVPGAAGTWRDLTENVNELAANLTTQVRAITEVATAVTKGDLTRSIAVEAQGEVAILKDNVNLMIANLRETTQKNTEEDWLKTNLTKFTRMLQGQRDLETVSRLILSELAPLVSAQHGVFYLMDGGDDHTTYLKLLSTYAYRERKSLANRFQLGEGLVGQCALEKERILLTEVPHDYIKISSGLGEATPLNAVVLPVLFEGQVTAVIELASFRRFSEIHLTFFDQLTESIAIVLNTIAASMRTEELLKQSQSLAEELQTQQKELTGTNQRLEQQAQTLQASEQLLKNQQEQLQQTNEELQEKAELLALQNREVERKNREIEHAKQSLEEKAEQLALTSKYKSEFLANMSHELRTPLNSMLILTRLLDENDSNTLSEKQLEYVRTINAAGSDLLMLINDILDLAKIESGTMSVSIEQVPLSSLCNQIKRTFAQVAIDKNLDFEIHLEEKLPRTLQTDSKRLQQVLKNLLANAFKFTEQGWVRLEVNVATKGWNPEQTILNEADQVIAFAVSDTGIGIASDKQQVIFETFQQADGTTSRHYGGTGLGLSISREIAHLLGGQICLVSELSQGSIFTLYLPLSYKPQAITRLDTETNRIFGHSPNQSSSSRQTPTPSQTQNLELFLENELKDDREVIQADDRTLLIIEDDLNFARILLDLVRKQGFKGLVALRGDVGLVLAQEYKPSAIMLDIRLPVLDGWMVLDRLKHDLSTRHIPVHIMSVEEGSQRSLQQGAIAYLQKPVSSEALLNALRGIKAFIERPVKNLLIVEDDELQRNSLMELIGNGDVTNVAVATGAEALEALRSEYFDCMVLDLGLPDMNGFNLLEQIKQDPTLKTLPIIVYTGKELTPQEETQLRRVSESIIVKDVQSPERLLDETALFLHRIQANLPKPKQSVLEKLQQNDPVLVGKRVLIVDDDVRNIFALTNVLERYQMQVFYAENGRDGIRMLQSTPEISLVLMDIMMPEMDGYETMQAIRNIKAFASIPIIALTAKAMQGDREKCIEAGASDYITKPIELEHLLSLMRVWLYR